MKKRKRLRGMLGRLLLVVLCVHGVGQWTQAQIVRVNQPNAYPLLFLPEVRAAYARGQLIDAQANWIRAQGDYQVSLSKARQMNATAASMEMDNAIKWVETYFRRKEINREYRRKLNPTYIQRVQKANRLKHLILADDPTFVFKGDVTDELNWMLERLATTALMQSLFFQEDAPQGGADLDKPLDVETLKHLNFSKGEKIGVKSLYFELVWVHHSNSNGRWFCWVRNLSKSVLGLKRRVMTWLLKCVLLSPVRIVTKRCL